MMLKALLVLCVVALVKGSPHADLIAELAKSPDLRIVHDILEDASLDVPDLIKKYNYPSEVHSVTTEDGYVLEMHRIPHGRDKNNKPGPRPVVILMHGLGSSSADWIVKGPGCAFGYILAEEGFDVWMGNARGTYYSRKHVRLNPDAHRDTTYWRFSWDEIGNKDVPAMIDYALRVTGRDALHYVGHSQGTTVFFVMASLRPEYNQKIISMHAYAPVAYMEHNYSRFFLLLAPVARRIELALRLVGVGEFLPKNRYSSWAGQNVCIDGAMLQPLCTSILFQMAGHNEGQLNATLLPLKLGHVPAGASGRQVVHYAQGVSGKEFARFDHGNILGNMVAYRRPEPPKYDLSLVTAPVYLHYSLNDPFSALPDVERLYRELGSPSKARVSMESFNHVDYIWAIDASTIIYYPTIELMKSVDPHFFSK